MYFSSGAYQPAAQIAAPQLDLEQAWARVRDFGRFPKSRVDPQTEIDKVENKLYCFVHLQKRLGIPDEVWHELRSYGAPQPVDAKQALIDDVKAFVQDYRRLPKQSRTDKKEKCLADRLRKYKSNLDNAQLVELLECEDAVEDAKKIGWRLLLDEAKAFVRDFGRWPKANDTHIKEDVLATRLAKGKKEFDSVHRTELQDLEKRFKEDTRQRAAEGVVKEVKDAKQSLVDDVKASVRDYQRRPKRSRTDKEENSLAMRLGRYQRSTLQCPAG